MSQHCYYKTPNGDRVCVGQHQLNDFLASSPDCQLDEDQTDHTPEPQESHSLADDTDPEAQAEDDELDPQPGEENSGTAPEASNSEARQTEDLSVGSRVRWTKPCGTIAEGEVVRLADGHALVFDGKKKIKVRANLLKLI